MLKIKLTHTFVNYYFFILRNVIGMKEKSFDFVFRTRYMRLQSFEYEPFVYIKYVMRFT